VALFTATGGQLRAVNAASITVKSKNTACLFDRTTDEARQGAHRAPPRQPINREQLDMNNPDEIFDVLRQSNQGISIHKGETLPGKTAILSPDLFELLMDGGQTQAVIIPQPQPESRPLTFFNRNAGRRETMRSTKRTQCKTDGCEHVFQRVRIKHGRHCISHCPLCGVRNEIEIQ